MLLAVDDEERGMPARVLSQILEIVLDIKQTMAGSHKPFYTVEEIAQLTGRSAYTVRRWIADKRLDAIRVKGSGPRGRLLIPKSEILKIVETGQGSTIPDILAQGGGVVDSTSRTDEI